MKRHFYQNHRWFFALAAILPVVDAADTLLKGWGHFISQGIIYPITILVIFICSVVAAVTRNKRYHSFFAIFFLVYILAFISINLMTLV